MMDFLAQDTTITETYCVFLLQKVREAFKTKRRGMLIKDNTPIHNSHIAQMEAQSCSYEILPHPPSSPDLAPSDFHLFPTMKGFLKGKHFSHDETPADIFYK